MTDEKTPQVDWRKVAAISSVGIVVAVVPWLLGLATKRQLEREASERDTVYWSDANRWE